MNFEPINHFNVSDQRFTCPDTTTTVTHSINGSNKVEPDQYKTPYRYLRTSVGDDQCIRAAQIFPIS